MRRGSSTSRYTLERDVNLPKDFPGTKQVVLDENYRSTGSILAASMAIVSEGSSPSRKLSAIVV
jgi:DNA helicase-2/ATP-dependent DNA helicase PcrA